MPEGRHKFVFQADPPKAEKIPASEVVGVTVILLTCSYRNQEFIRVGYYVSNQYDDPEMTENPPETPDFEKLKRNILASNPRVTKFKINWDDPNAYKSPLLDENIPPIPNALPPKESNEPLAESPTKKSLAHMTEESNQSMKSEDSNDGMAWT